MNTTIITSLLAASLAFWPSLLGAYNYQRAPVPSVNASRVGPSYLYPNPATTPGLVNPGVAQANIHATICFLGWTATVRPPVSYTNALKRKQLAEMRATDQDPRHWEEDHAIPLELGGHPVDPRNLWPEMWGTPGHPLTNAGPFPAHLVGAKSKDQVENALRAEVCAGRMTLREAQRIIITDWYAYYRDHVLGGPSR